ncbi:MAG: hypothetical protein F6K62_00440 [Sphaerospermopsis sp. SIO1G2]|nr:hypothetical protein [Sphaerospermopsis sp. SIO1G1]NET69564.1 hypothetical protein [Sphaerospermopsis sp. SIO1G2]
MKEIFCVSHVYFESEECLPFPLMRAAKEPIPKTQTANADDGSGID